MGCSIIPPKEDIERLRAIYDSAVSYHDQQLGRLVKQLKEWGIWDQTQLIVTADHGAELFEDGRCGHGDRRAAHADRRPRPVPRAAHAVEKERMGRRHEHDRAGRRRSRQGAAVKAALLLLAACGAAAEAPRSTTPPPSAPPAPSDAAPADTAPDAPPPPPTTSAEVWLKGSPHVHERASGDSRAPLAKVITWYEERHYDFIVVTDHNKVTAPQQGASLIVIAGTELTFNPSGCLPDGDKSKKCRIHVNGLGVTERPAGKIEWANRHTHDRHAMYEAAIDEAHKLGARVIQSNHPLWYWGMTGDLLAELAQRGAVLVVIANAQFPTWNAGDPV